MIYQEFTIPQYRWKVRVWYAVDDCYTDEICAALKEYGSKGLWYKQARKILASGFINDGLTYSDCTNRRSLVVIGITTSASEFHNTYEHEKHHLVNHIAKTCHLPEDGEAVSYLDGYIAQQMFRRCAPLMCECCRKKLSVPDE